jgi:hypothetical protein
MPVNMTQIIAQMKTSAVHTATKVFDWKTILYLYLPTLGAIAITTSVIHYLRKKSKTSKLLYFTNDNEAELVDIEINDKLFSYKNKKYYVDKARPAYIADGIFGKKPLYIVKNDVPLTLTISDDKIILSSDTLEEFLNMKLIKQLMTPQEANEKLFMGLAIGAVLGIILTVAAYATKVMKA